MPTPLPTLPAVYYGYLWMTYQGNRCGSVFTWLCDAAPVNAADDLQNAQWVADSMVSSWNTNMLPRYPSLLTGTDARVYALGHPVMPAALSHTAGTGAAGGDVAPVASAAVIRHTVLRRGRGSQSHTQISPLLVAEIETLGESVKPAFITNMNTDFGNFIGDTQAAFATASGGPTISYVQLSKKGAGATYPITNSFTEALLGTERSRTSRP
jgi:hypothetical protein